MVSTSRQLICLKFTTLSLFYITYLIYCANGANHELKYATATQIPNTITRAQITSDISLDTIRRNTGLRFRNVAQICANGMWALYNVPDFGEGIDDPFQVQVISIRSRDIRQCTQVNFYPQVRSVVSVRYLGNRNAALEALNIFTRPAFIGAVWTHTTIAASLPAEMTGFQMGSLAITGITNKWRICGDTACLNAVCVDMNLQPGGLFWVRNIATDTSTNWPKVIRLVQVVSTCDGDVVPPTQAVSNIEVIS